MIPAFHVWFLFRERMKGTHLENHRLEHFLSIININSKTVAKSAASQQIVFICVHSLSRMLIAVSHSRCWVFRMNYLWEGLGL